MDHGPNTSINKSDGHYNHDETDIRTISREQPVHWLGNQDSVHLRWWGEGLVQPWSHSANYCGVSI